MKRYFSIHRLVFMRSKKISAYLLKGGIAFIFCMLVLYSCEYEFIEVPIGDSADPVSFSEDILPVLTENNNCTVCHRSGSQKPYFTEDVAYHSIVPALIDTLQPDASRFYVMPNPSSPEHSFKKYSQSEAAMVLIWIQQGAKNN